MFCNRMEPLQHFNSFGISERVRTETSSSRFGSVRFSLVQSGFLRQGFQIPRSQNQSVFLSSSHYPPLHHAHVLPPDRHQVAVVVQEAHIGHMTAVAAVAMARSLCVKKTTTTQSLTID